MGEELQKLNSVYQFIKVLSNFPDSFEIFFLLLSIIALSNRIFLENRNILRYRHE